MIYLSLSLSFSLCAQFSLSVLSHSLSLKFFFCCRDILIIKSSTIEVCATRELFFYFISICFQFLLTFWLRGHFGSIRRSSGSRLTFMACCDWWCEPRSKPCISFCERPGTSSWACPFSFAGALEARKERKITLSTNNYN